MITAGGGGISSSCFTNAQQGSAVLPPPQPMMYGGVAPAAVVNNSSSINEATSSATTTADFITRDDDHHDHHHESSTSSFLYNLSILKDKVNQVQSLATMFIISSSNNNNNNNNSNNPSAHFSSKSTGMAIANLDTLIQEIIVTASSMMFTSQQLALTLGSTSRNVNDILHHSSSPSHLPQVNNISDQGFYPDSIDHQQWYDTNDPTYNNTVGTMSSTRDHQHHQILMLPKKVDPRDNNNNEGITMMSYDIVELDAADLLAKYTHYCQVCGKGFKRDANLRMHMRAHGDEYKTSAALMSNNNQFKKVEDQELGFVENNNSKILPRKYSCPQEGCKWNKKHAKFTPLKSMICVKNHYKRSHCPKMYVCKRCNRKEFSVLSDLRTHEKHCGDILKWQCTCGTTFSRKDKLMGHVASFVGHSPAITSLAKMGKTPAAAAHHILQDS